MKKESGTHESPRGRWGFKAPPTKFALLMTRVGIKPIREKRKNQKISYCIKPRVGGSTGTPEHRSRGILHIG